jgi:predicted adenine nucleotide alpha hydrolase (AANH) superfamily ATPase
MDYIIKFTDKKYNSVEEWLDDLKSEFKFQINDKIVITPDSFDVNLFTKDEDGENVALKEVTDTLNSNSTEKDSIEMYGIGYHIFIISDIEYVFINNGCYGRIYLSKLK